MSDEQPTNRRILTGFWVFAALLVFGVYLIYCANPWNTDTYPRLAPWELASELSEDTTILRVKALSHACNLDRSGTAVVTETFDRVEVYETPFAVTIETWLGPPRERGFWRDCPLGQGYSFATWVHLAGPLGSRKLVDPACELDSFANFGVCRDAEKPPYVAPRSQG